MSVRHLPPHVCENYEETETAVHRLAGVMLAIETLLHDTDTLKASREANAVMSLVAIASDMVSTVNRKHKREWVGLGGSTNDMSEAEIEAARGDGVAFSQMVAAMAAANNAAGSH